MSRAVVAILVLAAAASHPVVAAATPRATAGAPAAVPLIARDQLFGNPVRTGARISPDGRWLSWIAPIDGVMGVWVAPVAAPRQARALTAGRARPIRRTVWSPDSRTILFLDDHDGDENFLLYGVDVASGAQRGLTPFEHARVKILATSRTVEDRILLGIVRRDPHWQDVFSLDLATGALRLVLENDRYDDFVADANLELRLASRTADDGSVDWFRVHGDAVDDAPLAHVDVDDVLATSPLSVSADGRTLWWLDPRGADTVALVAQDMATGRLRTVARDARADVGAALFDPRTGAAQAYSLDDLAPRTVPLDPRIATDLAFLQRASRGVFTITSRTDDDRRWVVVFERATSPSSTWLYDRGARRLTPLYVGRPALAEAPLVAMRPVEIRARDGLRLVSYLSLPRAAAAGRPVPLVLFVHGGPWERDTWGYNAAHQWLANRGYAVLSVNFRGSAGFGKAFVAAGDRQWGKAMQDDLLDAVDWAVRQGVATPDRVAIMGGSYGGYATLAGMAFTPGRFACGVDIVGPSSLTTMLDGLPPYWASFRAQFYRRVGDPTTADGRAMLEERSPLNAVDRIARPLLIGQGANDPRVPRRESDQIVAAMKARGVPVTYVVFPDEGHGFARPANNLAFLAVAENFLARCLGGRAEPVGDALRASTAQVHEDAGATPGLAAAASSATSRTSETSETCVTIRVRDGQAVAAGGEAPGDAPSDAPGDANQARASATSTAIPACSASSEP